VFILKKDKLRKQFFIVAHKYKKEPDELFTKLTGRHYKKFRNRCNKERRIKKKKHLIWYTRVYPKVSGLASWSENCKWYSSMPLGAVVSLFCESV
jgi:hypothetical protein